MIRRGILYNHDAKVVQEPCFLQVVLSSHIVPINSSTVWE
jgi:hypothetical protein